MVKTPEEEEERKQNAKRKHDNAPLMNYSTVLEEAEAKKMKSESSKSIFPGGIPVKPRTQQIKIARSSHKLAELGFGHGNNHTTSLEKQTNLDNDDDEDEEEEEEEQEEEEGVQIEEEEEVKKTEIDENFRPSKMREYLKRKANQSASEKKNTIVDDKEEETEKMRSNRRNLDGELKTPQTQTAGKSRIGSRSKRRYRGGDPAFGYSIDGQKLPKHPEIEGLSEIIGDCSDPFEKKLLKTDVERIILHRDSVNRGICPYLTEDEKAKLTKGGILVNTYDELGYYEMIFESYQNCFYKLCNGWKRLYKRNQLKEIEDCYVAVWMFRHKHTGGVCFAVTVKDVKFQD